MLDARASSPPAGHVSPGRRPAAEAALQLEARFAGRSALAILEAVLLDGIAGRVALVSSFGAESAVLLHMVAGIDPATPVIFLDTGCLFAQTHAYRQELTGRLGLEDVRVVTPDAREVAASDPAGTLNQSAPDACCALRKVRPLARALAGFDGWITGRKRHQARTRARLPVFEAEPGTGRLKINPLAHWGRDEVRAAMARLDLPMHPLVARGYASIGCAPCTRPVRPGEDARAGRWAGLEKTECGIHLPFPAYDRPEWLQ